MEYWNSFLTEKSWEILKEIKKKYNFILIGGWATYLWTRQQKSKDIDIIVDIKELQKLKKESLIKNDHLKKYEIKVDEIDIDIYVDPIFDIKGECKISAKEAEGWLLTERGSLSVPRGTIMEEPELVKFTIPDGAPPCTIIYKLDINKEGGDLHVSTKVYLTIKAR